MYDRLLRDRGLDASGSGCKDASLMTLAASALASAGTVLDVGFGTNAGLFSAALLAEDPEVRVTALSLPDKRSHASDVADVKRVLDRVFRGPRHTLVWAHEDPLVTLGCIEKQGVLFGAASVCRSYAVDFRETLARARALVRPGGLLLAWEYEDPVVRSCWHELPVSQSKVFRTKGAASFVVGSLTEKPGVFPFEHDGRVLGFPEVGV
jgi:hypothetical protein